MKIENDMGNIDTETDMGDTDTKTDMAVTDTETDMKGIDTKPLMGIVQQVSVIKVVPGSFINTNIPQ